LPPKDRFDLPGKKAPRRKSEWGPRKNIIKQVILIF
jgi:hypothetical protein